MTLLLYLDTSLLSNFAKVELGIVKGPSTIKWRTLLESLRNSVEKGKLICPASEFQVQEALLAPELFMKVIAILSELSRGYFFKEYKEIIIRQTAIQLLDYLGRPSDISYIGQSFLTREPPSIPLPATTRAAKKDIIDHVKGLRENGEYETALKKQYLRERHAFIDNSFLKPVNQLFGRPVVVESEDPIGEILYSGFLGQLRTLCGLKANEAPKVDEFLHSDMVDNIAFIHIFCLVNAFLTIGNPQRSPQEGDWLDVAALASVLSYCDFVTTDKDMKEILRQLRLGGKYNAKIFSPKIKDIEELNEKLTSL